MISDCTYLPYSDAHSFSPLVTDYINGAAQLKPFYQYGFDKQGLQQAIQDRAKYPVNRQVLVSVLQQQYASYNISDAVTTNIALLAEDNTYTVCTAHQPNLLTGYLYFIYKIVHAIKLAAKLKEDFPDKNFVPVYYMGSEDNDLDELGVFRYNGQKFRWDADGQTGAVGRMSTASLKPLLETLFRQMGPPGPNLNALLDMIRKAYLEHTTIGAATLYLVNELFGRYGLVVLDPDNAELKNEFIAVMKDDLLQHTAHSLASEQTAVLSELYKVQAYPRPINLFYLADGVRERIERHGDTWTVLNTSIAWNEREILNELEQHPESFSPNVILRGLFQETILPNVVFIGGGAEVAYWLQLRPLFEHYNVFYPSIHLRQSVMWANAREHKIREQLGLSTKEIFLPETELVHQFVKKNSQAEWQVNGEMEEIETILHQLRDKANVLDPTLRSSAEAALTKMRYQAQVLEKKMLRAEKKKMQEKLLKIEKLKQMLFPGGGLQERVENFMPWYLSYGAEYIDILYKSIDPYLHQFLVIEETEP